MKRIVLCADDYGQAPSISEAILALIERKRLSAVSCLVNMDHWSSHAKPLSAYQHEADIGLHLNLTEGKPLSRCYKDRYGDTFFPLTSLMKRVFLHPKDTGAFLAEGEAQLACFTKAMGFLPHYLDGHQHVHQFAGIRQVIVELYKKYYPDKNAYVRLVNPALNLGGPVQTIKKSVVLLSGAFFKRLLKQHAIPHNASFSGIYHFNQGEEYRKTFLHFAEEVKEGGLIMCHPGLHNASHQDSIAGARYREYQYFSSPLFLEDCLSQGLVLQRFFYC